MKIAKLINRLSLDQFDYFVGDLDHSYDVANRLRGSVLKLKILRP